MPCRNRYRLLYKSHKIELKNDIETNPIYNTYNGRLFKNIDLQNRMQRRNRSGLLHRTLDKYSPT